MYLFRVLNEFDIDTYKQNVGLIAKNTLFSIASNYYSSDYSFSKLPKTIQEEYINTYINSHQNKLNKRMKKIDNEIKTMLLRLSSKDKIMLSYILSTLGDHVRNGSKYYTDWISFTTEFDSIFPYYDKSHNPYVAVVETETNLLKDLRENILAVDIGNFPNKLGNLLSKKISEDDIQEYLSSEDFDDFILDKIRLINQNFVGYNYAKKAHEICYYKYVPNNLIVSILEQLQIDLICADIFNQDFFKLSKEKQKESLIRLKECLSVLVYSSQDCLTKCVFDELYIKNRSIKDTNLSLESDDKIKNAKSRILSIANKIPNENIKML